MTEQYIQVNSANICYEVEGTGPYIIFISGGNGGHLLFKRIRDLLVKHFTVALYDRHGYFRSKLTGPQNYTKNVETNVEDLYMLTRKITDEKVILFGISGSAAIGLKYLVDHPETVLKFFIHEPLLYLEISPNVKDVRAFHYYIYRIFHTEGKSACMNIAGDFYFNELDQHILTRNQKNENINNWNYWFEHEFCEDLFTAIDLDLVKVQDDKLIFLHGAESKENVIFESGSFIAKCLGIDNLQIPSGHIGFYTHSKEFVTAFLELCRVNSLIKCQPKL